MAKAPITRNKHTRKDREKAREERKKAKEKGERISLTESRKRAGVYQDKAIKKPTTEIKKPATPKPTIELNKPEPKDERNILQKITGDLPGFHQLREEGRLKTGSLPLGPNVGALSKIGSGGDIYVGADAAVNQIVSTARSELGGILGKYVLNPAGTATPTVSKVGQMTINTKTLGLSKSMLSKAFSTKAMALYGAWASSIFLGRWGQAEAPEAILIPLRDLIENAQTPEDWALVEEHLASAAEIADLSTWEEIILWSPFAAIPGIANKARGVAEGVQVLAESAAKVQELQNLEEETGESDFARQRREGDEASTQRRLEEQALDSQYFQLIRDKKYEEAEELLQSRLAGEE